MILLHGFPDSGRLWRHQIAPLADAGFKVIVPDMRGYGASGKPTEVDDYNILYLVADVGAVLDEVGVEKAHVVGHDWGAAVAWALAAVAPDRVDQLVALSVGHPSSFRAGGYEQQEKSWYMLLFQFPDIAEQWLSERRLGQLPRLGRASRRGCGDRRTGGQRLAHARPQLVPGQHPPESYIAPPLALPPIAAPTMGVWSSGDIALTEGQMTRSRRTFPAPGATSASKARATGCNSRRRRREPPASRFLARITPHLSRPPCFFPPARG